MRKIEDITELLCHLKLGTARIRFYDILTKEMVDKINITRPFFLRVETYGELLGKDLEPKFKNNNYAAKMLFKAVLDKGAYRPNALDVDDVYKNMIDKVSADGYKDEIQMMYAEYETYKSAKEGKGFPVEDLIHKLQDADDSDEKAKQKIYSDFDVIKKDSFFSEYTLEDCMNFKVHRIRGGFNKRFYDKFGIQSNFNPYFLDWYYHLTGCFEIVVGSLVLTAESLMERLRRVGIGDYKFGYSVNAGLETNDRKQRAELLSSVNRNYANLAFVKDLNDVLTPELIKDFYEFNQQIPGYLFKNVMTKEIFENLIDEDLITDINSFAWLYHDDEVLAKKVVKHNSFAYRSLSKRLKLTPEIYHLVDVTLQKFWPAKLLSNRELMLSLNRELYDYHLNVAHKKLMADIDFILEMMSEAEDWKAHIRSKKNLSAEFLDELRHVGATVILVGDMINMSKNFSFVQNTTEIKFNRQHLLDIKTYRFNKKLQAELSSKEIAPKRKNKI